MEEAFAIRPQGVTWCFATLGLHDFGQDHFEDALLALENAATELAERRVDLIVYTGMPLTVYRGPQFQNNVLARIRGAVGDAIPVQTDGNLVIEALRALKVERLSVVTPYQRPTVDALVTFLTENGFDVEAATGMELSLAQLLTELDWDTSFEEARRLYREHPDVDGLYLGCPQWPLVQNISRIERYTGRPVVTQLQAVVWWASQSLGLDQGYSGFGRLLEDMPAMEGRL